MALQQAGIAVGVLGGHETLVSQADDHFRPFQRLRRQALKERHRAASAGHHQRGQTVFADRLHQARSHVAGQRIGQLLWGVEVSCYQPCRQL